MMKNASGAPVPTEQEEIWLEGVTGGGSKEKRKDRK